MWHVTSGPALPCFIDLFRDSRRGLSLLLHLTPSPFGHESHCPGEVHQGQSDPKVTQLTAGTGAEDRPRFAIPAEAIHAFSSEEAQATPGVGHVPPRPYMLSARRRRKPHRELGMSRFPPRPPKKINEDLRKSMKILSCYCISEAVSEGGGAVGAYPPLE